MKNDTKSKLSRRNFLITAGVGGVATAAAIATQSVTPHKPNLTASTGKRGGKGYQETAHVRSYYNTSKV